MSSLVHLGSFPFSGWPCFKCPQISFHASSCAHASSFGPTRTTSPYCLCNSSIFLCGLPLAIFKAAGNGLVAQSLGPGNRRRGWKKTLYMAIDAPYPTNCSSSTSQSRHLSQQVFRTRTKIQQSPSNEASDGPGVSVARFTKETILIY